MSIQTRTNALQNEIVRLYCVFTKDGVLTNPIGQPIVDILDTDGVTVLDSVNAQYENAGIFYADWYVPANLPLGSYYDRWNFQWDASSGVQEMTMIFSVHSLSSYINFINRGFAINTSDRAAQLVMDLANDFIYEAQHIPIYFEQGMRIQQDNQTKRTKNYYYFVLDNNESYRAFEGDIYQNNGIRFTVFETLPFNDYSSSSSSESSSSSSSSSLDSSSSSSIDSSSSSSSSSIDSSSSLSSLSSDSSTSSSSSSLDSSSSTNYPPITTTTTTPYQPQIVLTCVASGNPSVSGVLSKVSGEGSSTLNFTSVTKKTSKFSTIYGFAYQNWNQDPRPVVRWNNRLVDDGWHADYQGYVYWDGLMAPEDSISAAYNFAYFSQQELQSFLRAGLQMMNAIKPASVAYSALESSPYQWDFGIILYAAIVALKRLIFGLNFQEKMIIFGTPEQAQNAQAKFQELYASYTETFDEFAADVKTLKLPGIALFVTPEYTLPGGRSRWFRYLYKQNG